MQHANIYVHVVQDDELKIAYHKNIDNANV